MAVCSTLNHGGNPNLATRNTQERSSNNRKTSKRIYNKECPAKLWTHTEYTDRNVLKWTKVTRWWLRMQFAATPNPVLGQYRLSAWSHKHYCQLLGHPVHASELPASQLWVECRRVGGTREGERKCCESSLDVTEKDCARINRISVISTGEINLLRK
jgi:hypothetical protein